MVALGALSRSRRLKVHFLTRPFADPHGMERCLWVPGEGDEAGPPRTSAARVSLAAFLNTGAPTRERGLAQAHWIVPFAKHRWLG
ncbi:MAG: hypothetical protein KatS3mg077_1656 [Candidatus Binatia bacterium]|nr:MAG: hypothetical protein KatS3mg077_1656 [Candidatus Binatia bacterium]